MSSTSLRVCKGSSQLLTRTGVTALSLAITLALAIIATPTAQAQTFNLLYTFTGGADGGGPQPGLTMDGAGNFYGANGSVGLLASSDCRIGSVYHFWNANSGWVLNPLYDFQGPPDGCIPSGRVALAQDGTLYGVTNQGGNGSCQFGCGTAYHLTPAPSVFASWNETVIHNFVISEGWYPQGDLAFDAAGNLYGTAAVGGPLNNGLVYQLARSEDNWAYTVLHSFQGSPDGEAPSAGVVLDASGNIYGITQQGGIGVGGTIYQLSQSGSTWTEQTVYSFTYSSGCVPVGGLIIDSSGNLYGTTTACGANGAGTVFKFIPASRTLNYSTTCLASSVPVAFIAIYAARRASWPGMPPVIFTVRSPPAAPTEQVPFLSWPPEKMGGLIYRFTTLPASLIAMELSPTAR